MRKERWFAFWFEGSGVNGVGNVSGKSTWGGDGFNKAGFDGASEKPVWIWNFTVCIFEMILMDICYGDDNEIYDDEKESDNDLFYRNLSVYHDSYVTFH